MIIYNRLWETMEAKGISEEQLQEKGIKAAEMDALRNNDDVSTRLIEKLCVMLSCEVEDVMTNR